MKKALTFWLFMSVMMVVFGSSSAIAADKFPDRPLEFIACYGPGGGHDIMMRTMAKILREGSIITTPINVVNKPGGGGAVGMGYVNKHKGDGHYLMATTSSFITTPLKSDIGLTYKNFTPIARLGFDPEVILVNTEKKFNSLDDVLKSKEILNVGGSGQGSLEHIMTVQLGKAVNKKLNYIPFQGDGQVVAALMGNQVDMIVSNPGSAVDFIKAGKFKALGISSEQRLELMPDVPTLTELGYPLVLGLFRGVAAPGDISKEAADFYKEALRKMVKTDAWRIDYLEKNKVLPAYLEGDDYGKYLDFMNVTYHDTLVEVGILKK